MNAAIAADAGWSIPIGTPVFDVAGERIGSVVGADLHALKVARGRLRRATLAIPLALVARYEDGKLFLSVSAAKAIEQAEAVAGE